jgi:hypothetical protein
MPAGCVCARHPSLTGEVRACSEKAARSDLVDDSSLEAKLVSVESDTVSALAGWSYF